MLPVPLAQAVTGNINGGVVLVVGAGCSVQEPTSLQTAGDVAFSCYEKLVNQGVLVQADCDEPRNLSAVAEAVFKKTGSQADLVAAMGRNKFRNAEPNEGYLLAAALMRERIVACVLTLNFDLAMSSAIAAVGGDEIAVIDGPQDHPNLALINVIFLHRSALADPDAWILRQIQVEETWRGDWRQIVSMRVLSSPFIVFAGLGSPASVLIETAKNIRAAIPNGVQIFQVDVVDPKQSAFFRELTLPDSAYIRSGWNEFMKEIASRVVVEQVRQVVEDSERLTREENYQAENLNNLRDQLRQIGLLDLGKLRAIWLLKKTKYIPNVSGSLGFIADLLLGVAMIERHSGSSAIFTSDGIVEFRRGTRVLASIVIASGRGQKTWMSMEIESNKRQKECSSHTPRPCAVLIAGVQGGRTLATVPEDIVGSTDSDDILAGDTITKTFSFLELRQNANLIAEIVPYE